MVAFARLAGSGPVGLVDVAFLAVRSRPRLQVVSDQQVSWYS